jgi:hypothetical protein
MQMRYAQRYHILHLIKKKKVRKTKTIAAHTENATQRKSAFQTSRTVDKNKLSMAKINRQKLIKINSLRNVLNHKLKQTNNKSGNTQETYDNKPILLFTDTAQANIKMPASD